MGLTRRKFTREMKMAAIQQLDAGSSAAEVARAFEINASLLHRWRKEFQHGPAMRFPESASAAGRKLASPNWNGRSASKRWISIF